MHDIAAMLNELAERIAAPPDGRHGRCALAAVVADLETLAGLHPGRSDDAPVVLARRFARAHRTLVRDPSPPADTVDHLDRALATLRDPAGILLSTWNRWQELRDDDAPFTDRLAAREAVALARRAVCRS